MESSINDLVECASSILYDNKLPYFPDFTDHGIEHVSTVLRNIDRLIPADVFKQKLLTAEDAAVLIGSAVLHDIAMHFGPHQMEALLAPNSRFRPLPWFRDADAEGRSEQSWSDEWSRFKDGARHFTADRLAQILGPNNDGIPDIAYSSEPTDFTSLGPDDLRFVGEFLRTRHARLAHEIAVYGYPGLGSNQFPCLSAALPGLGNAIGLVARSHGEDLRRMIQYCEIEEPKNKRPWGVAAPYAMALLRVADYLDIDANRAPPILLDLRRPLSRTSIEEWNKHKTVSSLSWDHQDPQAVFASITKEHTLSTHLAMRDLFRGVQVEMDVSTAVLSEIYGSSPDLNAFELKKRRINTNLDEQSLINQLPYIPTRAQLRSDPSLFRLMVSDLYGNSPAIAGRELVQNAVDAVRVRREIESSKAASPLASAYREQFADVEVTIDARDPTDCKFIVSDKGVGMDPDLVESYFLVAGASFNQAMPTGAADGNDSSPTLKAGRFGIGAFASFLLGRSAVVKTRSIDAEIGIEFEMSIDGELIEFQRSEMPIGTEISVDFELSRIPKSESEGDPLNDFAEDIANFYRLVDPSVTVTVLSGSNPARSFVTPKDVPDPDTVSGTSWNAIAPPNFDAVLWRPEEGRGGTVVHNGISIGGVRGYLGRERYRWSDEPLLRPPQIAVFDSRHNLGLALNRCELKNPTLPFENELKHSIGLDIVANALNMGPTPHPLSDGWGSKPVLTKKGWFPFFSSLLAAFVDDVVVVFWKDPELDESISWFTSPETEPAVWRKIPHRLVLPLSAVAGDLEGREPGVTKTQVAIAAGNFSRATGFEYMYSLVSESGLPPSAHRVDDRGWREYDESRASVFKWQGASSLRTWSQKVLTSTRTLALSAFQNKGGPMPHTPFETPWTQILKKPILPYATSELEAERKRLRRSDPKIAELLTAWDKRNR